MKLDLLGLECITELGDEMIDPIKVQTVGKWFYPHPICPAQNGIDQKSPKLCLKLSKSSLAYTWITILNLNHMLIQFGHIVFKLIWELVLNTNHSHCMIFINYQELNLCIKNLQKCIREEKNKIGSPIQLQTFGKWWYPHSVCPRGIDTEGLCRKNYPDWESHCFL